MRCTLPFSGASASNVGPNEGRPVIVGTAALTHTPLSDRIRAPAELEQAFEAAVTRAAERVAAWKPDVTVVFFPDHFNGFHYDLMPAFCIGIEADSIGDWGTIPGKIDVPEDLALDCARACLGSGVDIAISYKMKADHGYAQVVESLSRVSLLSKVIPIFINCAAAPRPTFGRCRALGSAVGRWAAAAGARILLLASGGLSHDPPSPTLSGSTPELRARLTRGGASSHSERTERQQRVLRAGLLYSSGKSGLRNLNPDWDKSFLSSLSAGSFEFADHWSEDELTDVAGCGSHEIRTWLAAWSAASVGGQLHTQIEFSAPIPEWITSCAVATAAPSSLSAADGTSGRVGDVG
jgi:2,3-dihydroxyphenylpropionate 1,2-dioxygenase